METRYVTKHASASDSNGGTNATTDAWATPLKGFSSISGGDTLKFGTGTYVVDRSLAVNSPIPNGTIESPTVITDNGDGDVILQHSSAAHFSGIINFKDRPTAPEYISFIGTSAHSLIFDPNNDKYQAIFDMGGSNTGIGIRLKNIELRNARSSAIFAGDTRDLTLDNVWIHDCGTLSTNGVPQDHGVYASGENFTVKNCLIEGIWGFGIHCYNHNKTGRKFFNNIIRNVGFGAGSESADGIIMSLGSGEIYNNLIYKTGGHGINLWRTVGVTIYHNSIHQVTQYGVAVGNGSGANCSGTQVKNNIIIDNTQGSVRVLSNALNTVVSWNRMSGTAIFNTGASTTQSNNGFSAVAITEWVDPENVTLTSRDYNLKAGAASINPSGIESVGISTDIEGNARNFIDQGAYAYGTTTPPDPPIISHPGSEIVTHEFTDVSLTLTKGTNNIVTCTVSGTGASAISATPTNVTVVRN